MISGGSRRTTLSAVTLISSPRAERQLDQVAAGPVQFDADHQPLAADLLDALDALQVGCETLVQILSETVLRAPIIRPAR